MKCKKNKAKQNNIRRGTEEELAEEYF